MNSYPVTVLFIACLIFPPLTQNSKANDWSAPQNLIKRPAGMQKVTFALDSNSNIHLAWAEDRDFIVLADSIYYTHIAEIGKISHLILVGPGQGSVDSPCLAVDSNDIVHIIWTENNLSTGTPKTNRLLHSTILENRRTVPDTLFSVDSLNADVLTYNILAGKNSDIYVYWGHRSKSENRNSFWLRTWHNQIWGPPKRFLNGYAISGPNMFMDDHDSLHVTFYGALNFNSSINRMENLSRVWYAVMHTTDSLCSIPKTVYYNQKTIPFWPQIVVDNLGIRHILWQEGIDSNMLPDALLYSYSHDGKHWAMARDISQLNAVPFEPQMVIDSFGIIHLVWHQMNLWGIGKERGVYYRFGTKDDWSELENIFPPFHSVCDLDIDSKNRLHLIQIIADSTRQSIIVVFSWKDTSPSKVILSNTIDNVLNNSIQLKNYPNPFNSTTVFHLLVQRQMMISFHIYNIFGKEVKILLKNEFLSKETFLSWDGTDHIGMRLPSGLYFCQIKAKTNSETFQIVNKILLIR